ncbi:NAD(P)-dependent oxidoreductase [Plantactinospora sp. BB1]|uniref:NAD-dependent epimerase/dehydratase family protein n=1 Tax=Plantactinospora sp. BB1 TaxID=2071627 RepID=UPI000D15F701|nr:NAD(P)-dependent oxidoreductase [Plantactinospora sp. BB1]AVT37700.1 NAD(P)-dependent oxidoreductase [Plantactinospora sp. BB1]
MILVTGGLGFIGSHAVQALLDRGEECVLVQRRHARLPADRFGGPVHLKQADVTDLSSLRDVGSRHRITGIVHLAGSMPWPPSPEPPVGATRRALGGLLNIIQVAQDWNVNRVGVASTIGVYAGVGTDGALAENLPLPMTAPHPIPTFKKIGELLNAHLAEATGIDIVNYRISGTWGPLGHHDPFFPAPEFIHAAVDGRAPDLSGLRIPAHLDDALDLCYVKDTGRAIALLQTADKLHHRTYNVGTGRATTNAEVIAAIRSVIPNAHLTLPPGRTSSHGHLDITRLRQDTGYRPAYDTERAAADYISWLRAGTER